MNKEKEGNSYSGNDSNSSKEETDNTKEIETQIELNKNIEIEKLVEININTKEDSDSTQGINTENTIDLLLDTGNEINIIKINKLTCETLVIEKNLKGINDKNSNYHRQNYNNINIK